MTATSLDGWSEKEAGKEIRRQLRAFKTLRQRLTPIQEGKNIEQLLAEAFDVETLETLEETRDIALEARESVLIDFLRSPYMLDAVSKVRGLGMNDKMLDYFLKVGITCQCRQCLQLEGKLPELFKKYAGQHPQRPKAWYIDWFPLYTTSKVRIKENLCMHDVTPEIFVRDRTIEGQQSIKMRYAPKIGKEHLNTQ